MILKIIEKSSDGGDGVSYLFHFNTDEAKAEATAVKALLSQLINNSKASDPSIPRPSAATPAASTPRSDGANGTGSGSASMAFASAVNSHSSGAARWFDDNALKDDIELQLNLMKKDTSLHETYMDAMRTKPDSITTSSFNSQFWSTRLNLLRSFAIESNQKRGAYNVLSTMKPQTVDGELKLNITPDQVLMIFEQHPLVQRIYNENVPKISEASFWSRFFLSRLSKKLRGERVGEHDPPDHLFDKYDVSQNTANFQSKIMAQSVPHIIDIEANEENQGGFKSGNAKDVEMRPRANFAIIQTLNSLSERIMADVAPSDSVDPQQSASGFDAWSQLALRDLSGPAKEHRIMLNVKEQTKFFSKQDSAPSKNAQVFSQQNPSQVLSLVGTALSSLSPPAGSSEGINLQSAMGFNPESDSDSDDEEDPRKRKKKKTHVNSRTAILAAERDILSGLRQRRAQLSDGSSDSSTPLGLPASVFEKCTLTHATTIEFLHQFWSAFLSGDPDRAFELQYLDESLKKSLERIKAVGEEAEVERNDIIKKRRQEIVEHYKRTGKKIHWKDSMLGGGRIAVEKLMKPTVEALERAGNDYLRAMKAERMLMEGSSTPLGDAR